MPSGARQALALVWCRRARVLADMRPRPLAQTLEAVERALACPPETEEIAMSLLHCKAEIAHLLGDESTERSARVAIEEVRLRYEGHGSDGAAHETMARLVCFWWMAAHGAGLLESERDTLDVGPDGWSSLCHALREGRWDELPNPIPASPLHLNPNDGSSEPAAFLDCLKASAACGVLDNVVRVVELVLGRQRFPDPATPGVVPVSTVLFERRALLEAQGAGAEPEQIWYELHQGARRPETVERIGLIRWLHPVLARMGAVAPFAPVSVYLDRASESQARGYHSDERCALEVAVELSEGLSDREQRAHATVRLAALAWREGKLSEVEHLLGPLAGRQAAELRDRFRAAAPERAALMWETWHKRSCAASVGDGAPQRGEEARTSYCGRVGRGARGVQADGLCAVSGVGAGASSCERGLARRAV